VSALVTVELGDECAGLDIFLECELLQQLVRLFNIGAAGDESVVAGGAGNPRRIGGYERELKDGEEEEEVYHEIFGHNRFLITGCWYLLRERNGKSRRESMENNAMRLQRDVPHKLQSGYICVRIAEMF
jgi:hypothetical protein